MKIELSMMCRPWEHMPVLRYFFVLLFPLACQIIAFPYIVSVQTGFCHLLKVKENSALSLKELSHKSFGPFYKALF